MTLMTTYETTHPWLTFDLELSRAPTSLWLLLGHARSSCEHIARLPLLPPIADEIDTAYLIRGLRATAAIAGDSLSEGQVRDLLSGRLAPLPSRSHLHLEAMNLIEAFRAVRDDAAAGGAGALTPERVSDYNRLVLRGSEKPEGPQPGEVRRFADTAGRHGGAPSEDCLYLLDRLCGWLRTGSFADDVASGRATAILKAVIAHLYLAWIQPFADGNGRTARLAEHAILLGGGVPAAAAHLLTIHYCETRARYSQELERATKHWGSPLTFLHYAVEGFVDQLAEQLALVRSHQLSACWRDFVHQSSASWTSGAEGRRKELALAISRKDGGVSLDEVPGLTPRLAMAYSRRSSRTLLRDLELCRNHGLVRRTVDGRYEANLDILLPFSQIHRSPESA